MALKQLIAVLISISSLGAGGASGIYLYSLESFSSLLEKRNWVREDGSTRAWTKAQELFSDRKKTVDKISPIFKNLEEKTKSDSEALKKACVNGYFSSYRSFFHDDKVLLKNLNTFCRLKIKDVFEEKDLIKSDETENVLLLRTVNNLLKKHNVEIGNIGDNVKKGEFSWETYRKWCQVRYDLQYVEDDDSRWKVAYKYCRKTLVTTGEQTKKD